MSESKQAYISRVHLKGYKSIKDLEIDLLPGLNIIIGPNGSGKTNFVKALVTKILKSNYRLKTNASIEIQDSLKNSYKWIIEISQSNQLKNNDSIIFEDDLLGTGKLLMNGLELNTDNTISKTFRLLKTKLKNDFKKIFEPVVIPFGNIEGIRLLDQPENFLIDFDTKNVDAILFYPIFKIGLTLDTIFEIYTIDTFDKKTLIEILELKEGLLNIISKYSPIRDVRIKEEFVFNKVVENKRVAIDFLFLEFKMKDNEIWIPWKELSDGTKRIFNIICQVFSNERTILLEEPELGIHPDQLYKLMVFLVEQSKDKQIIITTHSPEVLNFVPLDELNRIIVTRYDTEKGTIMRKLSLEKAKQVGNRIKQSEMFLSDHWVHHELEDEIFNAENYESQTY